MNIGAIIITVLLVFVICIILMTIWSDWQIEKRRKTEMEEKSVSEKQPTSNLTVEVEKIGTKDLFLQTLTKIGCQYELGEDDDNRIFFAYQGEHFFADTTNDSVYVHLWDTHWGHVELYDIDEVSRLRKAINTSNINTGVTTVFTIDEMGKNMDVHSKATIPFIPSMPSLEDYLRVELQEFFRAHQVVGSEMHKLRESEEKVS